MNFWETPDLLQALLNFVASLETRRYLLIRPSRAQEAADSANRSSVIGAGTLRVKSAPATGARVTVSPAHQQTPNSNATDFETGVLEGTVLWGGRPHAN